MTELFWNEYWTSLASVSFNEETGPEQFVSSYRSTALTTLEPLKTELNFFSIAWAAHTLITHKQTAILFTDNIVDGFTWQKKLACLLLLDFICDQFVTEKSVSPFFPLLVQDSMECLRSAPNTSMEQACLAHFMDSLLPAILGANQFQTVQGAIENGTITENIRTILEDAIQKWIFIYKDETYVSPLLLFEPDQQKGPDIRKLAQAYDTNRAGPVELLKPLPSINAPFARPLPPPLLPLCGYEEEDEALTDREASEMLEYLQAELIWLTPTNLRLMLLPDDEDDDKEATERFRQVLGLLKTSAFVKPLAPNEQRMVMELLSLKTMDNSSDDENVAFRLIEESGLNPQNLPRLVEHNPLVAHECLLRILSSYPETIKNDYLSSLVGMDIGLHTMEVVNRLATQNIVLGEPTLHPEYIQLFVGSCIATCENIQDRHAQNRLVRLVCVFIQSLLKNKIVQVEDIYFEVQAFCVEFSRIREAATLFKSLKSGGL